LLISSIFSNSLDLLQGLLESMGIVRGILAIGKGGKEAEIRHEWTAFVFPMITDESMSE
jgi:hypothetical protein